MDSGSGDTFCSGVSPTCYVVFVVVYFLMLGRTATVRWVQFFPSGCVDYEKCHQRLNPQSGEE